MTADHWLKDPAYRGLLDDVVANPDDDTPRLVMADWLEEHGHDPRARFIRLQIERAGLSEHDRRAWECRAEEATLLAEHQDAWLGRLKKMVSRVEWRRGFVELVALGVNQMAKNAADVFSLTPVYHLQIMRLSQSKLPMADLTAIGPLSRTRSLCLRGSNLGDTRLADLLNAVPFPHLEELDLTGAGVGEQSLEAIKSRLPASLRSLLLHGNSFATQFPLLARSLGGLALAELDLGWTDLRRPDIDALADWPCLARIRHLGLSGLNLGVVGCVRLFGSPHLGPIEQLHLAGATIRAGGIGAIANCPRMASLRGLHLASCVVGLGGVEALAHGTALAGLEALDLSGNQLGPAGIRPLASWPGTSRLRSLKLGHNLLGDGGLVALLRGAALDQLTELSLIDTGLNAAAVRHLIACPGLSLARLDLSGNRQLKKEQIRELLASPTFAGLRSLRFEGLNLPVGYEQELRRRFRA